MLGATHEHQLHKKHLHQFVSEGTLPRNVFGMNPIIKDMQTAVIVAEEIGMKRASILSIMLHEPVKYGLCSLDFVREEFGEGNEFCKKITYSADNPESLLRSFRNDYYPRIAVTVDMIATGIDVKPIE